MKKSIILASLTVLLFGLTTVAHADDTNPRVNSLEAEIAARKQALAEKRASSMEASHEALAIGRIMNTAKAYGTHLTQENKRLLEIKVRIDSRLIKLEQQGADTSSAKTDLSLATADLGVSYDFAQKVADFTATTTSSSTTDALKQLITSGQSALLQAQNALLKVVADIRYIASPDIEASTTNDNQ